MNVLFIWDNPFKNGGGVGSVTAKLSEALVKRGFGVSYLSLSIGEQYEDNGVNQFFCNFNITKNQRDAIIFLRKFLQSNHIDIVINQAGVDKRVCSIIAGAKLNNVKVISVLHNCVSCMQVHFDSIIKGNYKKSIYYPLIANKFVLTILKYISKVKYSRYFKNAIDQSDKFVLLSKQFIPELDIFLKKYPEQKITAIANPAPYHSLGSFESIKENRLLYVGRIEFVQKQVDLLLEIWKVISAKHPDWHFDIVGNGSALGEIRQTAIDLELKNIHFYGQSDPVIFLEKAKFFIMTSSFEGFPMALIEAQAYGLVPFAFDSFSALTDIIEAGKNGFIIKSFDLPQYCDELSALILNENKRKQISINCYQAVFEFMSDNIIRQWIELFNELQSLKEVND